MQLAAIDKTGSPVDDPERTDTLYFSRDRYG